MTFHNAGQEEPLRQEQHQDSARSAVPAKLVIIGSLYIAFGMASGFFQTALPVTFVNEVFRSKPLARLLSSICLSA